jgi:hypothetical protein
MPATPRSVFALVVTLCVALLALTAGAHAFPRAGGAVEPGTRVNGMLVVQGLARDAGGSLFGTFCDPVVARAGRRTRSCGQLPPLRRIFVGYGIFAPEEQIESAWEKLSWRLWIDGRSVSLSRFGNSDRRLLGFAPAGYRDVVLREWAVILVGAQGRHSIRYRTRLPQGVIDTTWRFSVARS